MERRLGLLEQAEDRYQKETIDFRIEVMKQFESIRRELAAYRSFIGGMLFVFGALGAFLVYLRSWILTKLGIS